MKLHCAYCGTEDKKYLEDEGATIFCVKCARRTRKSDGREDSVECPYCHRMRDRSAIHCRFCNDSGWEESTPEEFAEVDEILRGMGV